MIENIFILGNHIQALGLARQAKKIPLKVSLFNNYKASITRFSNTCDSFHLYNNEEELLNILRRFAIKKTTLLIATNDALIHFLSLNYNELSSLYYLSISNPSIVDICYNKRYTYLKAIELGIPIPESYFPENIDHVLQISKCIKYPVIIKPAVMHNFHRLTGKKVLFCKTEKELISNYERVIEIIPSNEVIVQEFLTGGAKSLYSFGSYSYGGKVYGSFSANRIRQNPMDFGNSSTFAVTVNIPKIENFAKQFISGINYFGLSEIEFMKDPASGQYKLLEINPRAWKWHSIGNKLNINLLKMMIDQLNGITIEESHNYKEGIAWIERITDTSVVLKEILHGRMNFFDYCKTLKLNKENAVFAWNDLLPAIIYLILTPYLFFKRR